MKAKLKKKEENSVPEGIKIIDLGVEKRIELYQTELRKFDDEMSKTYGVTLSVELKFNPKGIVPSIVLVDLLDKKNAKQTPPTTKKEEKTK